MSDTGQKPAGAPEPPVPFRVFAFIIFVAGLGFSLVGAIRPDIDARFGLNPTQSSNIPLAYFLGDTLGLVAIGFLLQRSRALIVAVLGLMAPAAAWIALASSYSVALLVPFFALGWSAGIIITLSSMIVVRVYRGESPRLMNLMYGFFAAGVTVAPVGFGGLRALGLHYPVAYGILGAMGAAGFIAAFLTPFPRPDMGGGFRPDAVAGLWRDNKGMLLTVAAMNALYVGAESVPNAWGPKFLFETFTGETELRAAAVLSLFWGGMTAGRFISAAAIKRGVPARAMLVALLVLSAAVLAAAPFVGVRIWAEALLVAAGLFFSGVFPLIIAHTDHVSEQHTGTMFVAVSAAGMLGATAVSPLVGVVAEAAGFQWGMALAPVLTLAVLALAPVAKKLQK